MARQRSSTKVWTLWIAFGVSCTVHLLLFVELLRLIEEPDPVGSPPPESTSEAPEKLEVTMTREPPETTEPPERESETPEQPEEEDQQNEERDRQLERDFERKAVVQETNERQPEQADHVSSQANQVEQETRARETNAQFAETSESTSEETSGEKQAAEETKLGSKQVAARDSKPTEAPRTESRRPPEPSDDRSETSEQSRESDRAPSEQRSQEAPAPSESETAPRPTERSTDQAEEGTPQKEPLPLPTPDDLARLFDEKKDRKKVREHAEKGVGSDMYKRIEGNKGAVKSAMKNYISEIQPGNHTAVNAHADAAATYVNRIHSKIHPRWGGDYLPTLDARYGPDSPFSDSSLNTVLEFVVDGETGKLEKVNIVESSGLTAYDMEAVMIAEQVAPHPRAPEDIRSPDGNVYLHWNFWRDQRQCGTFGVSIYKLMEDGTREKTGDSRTE